MFAYLLSTIVEKTFEAQSRVFHYLQVTLLAFFVSTVSLFADLREEVDRFRVPSLIPVFSIFLMTIFEVALFNGTIDLMI